MHPRTRTHAHARNSTTQRLLSCPEATRPFSLEARAVGSSPGPSLTDLTESHQARTQAPGQSSEPPVPDGRPPGYGSRAPPRGTVPGAGSHSTSLGRHFVLNCRITRPDPSQPAMLGSHLLGEAAGLICISFHSAGLLPIPAPWASLGTGTPAEPRACTELVGLPGTPGHRDPGAWALVARHSPKGRQDLWGRDPGWALRTTRGPRKLLEPED